MSCRVQVYQNPLFIYVFAFNQTCVLASVSQGPASSFLCQLLNSKLAHSSIPEAVILQSYELLNREVGLFFFIFRSEKHEKHEKDEIVGKQ